MDSEYETDLSQYRISFDSSSSRLIRTSTPEVPTTDRPFMEKFDLVLSKSSSSTFQSSSTAETYQDNQHHYYHHQEHQQYPHPQSNYNAEYDPVSPAIRYVPSDTTIEFVPNLMAEERKVLVHSTEPVYQCHSTSNMVKQEDVFFRPVDPVYQYPPASSAVIKQEGHESGTGCNKQLYRPPQLVIPRGHRIYVNPSIWLSSNRAEYNGVGTPMPLLPTTNYFSQPSKISEWQIAPKKESPDIPIILPKPIPKHRNKKPNRRKRNRRKQFVPTGLSPEKLARFLLKIQATGSETLKNDDKSINLREKLTNVTQQSTTGVIESQRKPVDARVWLKAKAQLVAQAQAQSDTNKSSTPIKLETATKSKHFVDRAASPIDFKDDQIKPKTRDVALSPIRFIQSDFKRRKGDDENSIDLSSQLNTVPLISKCFIRTLRHKCSKCKISLAEAVEDGEVDDEQGVDEEGKERFRRSCPTCRAVNALCSPKEQM